MKKPRIEKKETAPKPQVASKRVKASLELAMLGLIAEEHPRSGYDLVQAFRISMVHYWHAHPGQIYPTLERMERDKWIAGREVIQRDVPTSASTRSPPKGGACCSNGSTVLTSRSR